MRTVRGVIAALALYVAASGVVLGLTSPPLSGGTLLGCALIVTGASVLVRLDQGGGPRWP